LLSRIRLELATIEELNSLKPLINLSQIYLMRLLNDHPGGTKLTFFDATESNSYIKAVSP
jgi:hypothetical protein